MGCDAAAVIKHFNGFIGGTDIDFFADQVVRDRIFDIPDRYEKWKARQNVKL